MCITWFFLHGIYYKAPLEYTSFLFVCVYMCNRDHQLFAAEPNKVVFKDYQVGHTYQVGGWGRYQHTHIYSYPLNSLLR